MKLSFNYSGLRKLCSSERSLVRRFGTAGARKVQQRLNLLAGSDTLEDMRSLPGRCHELKGDRSGQLAIDLHGGYRLIFSPAGDWQRKDDGGMDWSSVSEIVVLEITDHYK